MRRTFTIAVALMLWLALLPVAAQVQPELYYHSVQGLRHAELKTALHDLVQPVYVLAYGGKGEGYTWAGFAATDALPDGTVRDRYSFKQRLLNGLQAIQGMNIEHIWANSWWGHTVNNAYCDLFNLYPADGEANGRKSNNPIGVVDGRVAYDNGMTRVGKSSSYRADSLITAWEPADMWKGDFARTYFYMATVYQHMRDEWQTAEGLLTIDPASWQTMRPWVYELMMKWAAEDPVDDIERDRNEVICQIQGNRNPFVDIPQLADFLWGDNTESVFYIDPLSTKAELFVPIEDENIDFGLQALSIPKTHSIAVRGRNLPDGLTAMIEGEGFNMPQTLLTAEDVTRGARLEVINAADAAGDYAAWLVLRSSDSFEHRTPLYMRVIDGIPAYEAKDIVCSVNSKSFLASWMNMQLAEDEKYVLDVYTKGNDESRTSLDGYPVEVDDTTARVSGLQASTIYYYQVSARNGSLVSNEVRVEMPAVTPVFTASPSQMMFSTVPMEPSTAQTLKITALEVPQYVMTVTCPQPFEISTDGEMWTSELTLRGTQPTFMVRLGVVPEEGVYEGEMNVSCKGVKDIIVTLSATVDVTKAFFETFERGTKGGYAEAEVECNAATWLLTNALIHADENANDSRSVRMKTGGSLTMTTDKLGGCDSLWFYAGLYSKDTGVKLNVSYSQDAGLTWTPIVTELSFVKGEWQRYAYAIEKDGPIRLRFVAQDGKDKRINIDDIQMSNYVSSDAITGLYDDGNELPVAVYMPDGRYIGTHLPSRSGIYIVRRGSHVSKHAVR